MSATKVVCLICNTNKTPWAEISGRDLCIAEVQTEDLKRCKKTETIDWPEAKIEK